MTVAPASPRAAAIPRPAPRVAPATSAMRSRRPSGSGAQGMASSVSRRRGVLVPVLGRAIWGTEHGLEDGDVALEPGRPVATLTRHETVEAHFPARGIAG